MDETRRRALRKLGGKVHWGEFSNYECLPGNCLNIPKDDFLPRVGDIARVKNKEYVFEHDTRMKHIGGGQWTVEERRRWVRTRGGSSKVS